MIEINIETSSNYKVYIESGLLDKADELIKKAFNITGKPNMKLCVVSDETVGRLYGGNEGKLMKSLAHSGFTVESLRYPGGEQSKNIDTVTKITDFLSEKQFSRGDALVAFGGGITGDITGFAAAIYERGISFVQIPTTLLSAVDSSVGGKTGVNNNYGKNLIGAFHQPKTVIFDPDTLDTLSYELLLDGMAEIIKSGFIGDTSIIQDVRRLGRGIFENKSALTEIVAKAISVKRDIVRQDEFEHGPRRLLNLGHTLAHSIELLSNYEISHGKAVATGMAIISRAADNLGWSDSIAEESGEIREKPSRIIHELLDTFGYAKTSNFSAKALAQAALHDKKVRGDKVSLVYPYRTGECKIKDIKTDRLEEIISSGMNI